MTLPNSFRSSCEFFETFKILSSDMLKIFESPAIFLKTPEDFLIHELNYWNALPKILPQLIFPLLFHEFLIMVFSSISLFSNGKPLNFRAFAPCASPMLLVYPPHVSVRFTRFVPAVSRMSGRQSAWQIFFWKGGRGVSFTVHGEIRFNLRHVSHRIYC